jgi:hypothetical protein
MGKLDIFNMSNILTTDHQHREALKRNQHDQFSRRVEAMFHVPRLLCQVPADITTSSRLR